jgi:hypothetical protein
VLLIAASGLTKYFGVALIPLLIAYTFARTRRAGSWLAYFLVPIAIFGGYQLWTKSLYGRGLLWDAAQFATGQRATSGQPFVSANALMCLSFIGGCMLTLLIFVPLLASWKPIAACLGISAVLGSAIALGWISLGVSLQADQVARHLRAHWILVAIQLTICLAAGLLVFIFAGSDMSKRRNADSLLLMLWICGTFLFAGFLNWTINARSVLPVIPAVAILLARRFEAVSATKVKAAAVALLISGVISFWIAQADTAWADSARTAARVIHAKTANDTAPVWFQGHWGFQYYMQLDGAHPVDYTANLLRAGDLVVIPQNNAETYKLKKQFMASAELLDIPLHQQVATMRWELGAGFYSATWGPLPFAVGDVPTEQYYLFRVSAIPANENPWEDPFAAAGQK